MWLELNQSNVLKDDPKFIPMLKNLQANILKFHGRTFAHHLFFVINNAEDTRNWIKSFANTITTAKKQLDDAATKHEKEENNEAFDGGPIFTLSLSHFGFQKLGRIPDIDNNDAFLGGLRASAGKLNDHPDSTEPKHKWEDEFKEQIDMLIIVADINPSVAIAKADDIINQLAPFASLIKNQRGNVLKMKETGVGIEHFSYADGVSQPMYLADEINAQPINRVWDDETNLDMVLVKENDSIIEDCFGSYLVFRKLEQRVKDFKEAEGDNGPTPGSRLIKVNGVTQPVKDISGPNTELGGAMIVGRYENSTPVTKSSIAFSTDPKAAEVTNNFDYTDDKAGLKCPFHAHIRLMNPRKGDPLETDFKKLLKHRITRRAIPFDDHTTPFDASPDVNVRQRFDDNAVTQIEGEQLEIENQPDDKVGLLFMCYQSDIAEHFEVLQALWANQGLIGGPPVKGQDSLITQGTDLPRSIPQQWGQPIHSDDFRFSGFVVMKGGEYFYTPSIPFLESI